MNELTFNAAWGKVHELIDAENFQPALKLLSRFYHDDQLSGPQRQRLLGWLDALAGKVIFSEEGHLTGTPYVIKPNETLDEIASNWHVPKQLILNVNQNSLANKTGTLAGTQIKSLPGPFRAEVDLQTKMMTIFLGDLYAGRFPICIGISGEPKPGTFKVLVKSGQGHDWRDSNGVDYPPSAPENGYGPNWIGLSGSLCIHSIPDSASTGHHGCIGLRSADSRDVFAILAKNSEVSIIR